MALDGDTGLQFAAALKSARLQRRLVNAFIGTAVVGGILFGAVLEFAIDWGNISGLGIVSGVMLAAGLSYAAYWLLRRFVATPRCPACMKAWEILDDATAARLEKGQCPECGVGLPAQR